MESRLNFENMLVIDALQASLGLISRNIRGISVQLESGKIVLHFALYNHDADVVEDIDEMAFELDALRGGAIRIETRLYVGPPDKIWPGRAGRLIFLAHVPDP